MRNGLITLPQQAQACMVYWIYLYTDMNRFEVIRGSFPHFLFILGSSWLSRNKEAAVLLRKRAAQRAAQRALTRHSPPPTTHLTPEVKYSQERPENTTADFFCLLVCGLCYFWQSFFSFSGLRYKHCYICESWNRKRIHRPSLASNISIVLITLSKQVS